MPWFRPIGPIGSTTRNTTTSGSHDKSHTAGWKNAIAQSRPGVGQVGPGPWTGWPPPVRPSPGWLWPWGMPGVRNPMTIVPPPREPPGCTPGPGIGGLVPGAPGPVMSVSLPCKPGPTTIGTPPGEFGPQGLGPFGPQVLGQPPGPRGPLILGTPPAPDPDELISKTPPHWGPPLINKATDGPPEDGGTQGEPPVEDPGEPEDSKVPPSPAEAAANYADQAKLYAEGDHQLTKGAVTYAEDLNAMVVDAAKKRLPGEEGIPEIYNCFRKASGAAKEAQAAARDARQAADAAEKAASPKKAKSYAEIAQTKADEALGYRNTAKAFYEEALRIRRNLTEFREFGDGSAP